MKKPMPDMEIVQIEVVSGVEGPSLYLDQYRFAGNKPWGGGKIIHSWKVTAKDLRESLRHIGVIAGKEGR
jgi:hypothetical protein